MKTLTPANCSRITGAYLALLAFFGCRENKIAEQGNVFWEQINSIHNGDYLATYPLSSPDSCIARLKAEVPEPLQPWGCLSLWYHLPRTSPATSFKLLDLYEKNYPHDTVRAFAQVSRAEFYIDLAKLDSAHTCLNEAHDIYTRLNQPLGIYDVKYLQARTHIYQNNFAAALKSYFEALALLDAHDPTFSQRRSHLYLDIATNYERSGDFQNMLLWNRKAWAADLSKLEKPLDYKVKVASQIGLAYRRKENPDSALFWTKLAVDIQLNQLKKPCPPRLNYWLGRALFDNGNCAEALPILLESYRKRTDKQSVYGHYQYPMALGECYLCLGRLDSARIFIQESLASPDTGNLAKAHELLSKISAQKGDWKNALTEANESRRLNDIKFNSVKVKAVASLEAQLEASEKSRKITKLEMAEKNLRQKNIIIALLGALATVFATLLFFRLRARHQLLEKENQNLAQEKQVAKAREGLQALKLDRSNSELQDSKSALLAANIAFDKTSQLLHVKNQLVEDLQMRLTKPPSVDAEQNNNVFRNMKILTEMDWVYFQEHFDLHFPGHLASIKSGFPDLSAAERRLFLLIKLGFDREEIAETLGIAPESVSRTRHRLGKKLGLSETLNLDIFIRQFSAGTA